MPSPGADTMVETGKKLKYHTPMSRIFGYSHMSCLNYKLDLNEVREWKIEMFGERLFQALSMTLEEWRAHRISRTQEDTRPCMSGQKVDLYFKCAVKPLGWFSVWKERDLCIPAEPCRPLWWWAVICWALAFCMVLHTLPVLLILHNNCVK